MNRTSFIAAVLLIAAPCLWAGGSVYAHGQEIASKSSLSAYGIAFPDVKMTPPAKPSSPPGVPVPYPYYGMSKDTSDGVKKVKIEGKEVRLHRKPEYPLPQPQPVPKLHNQGKSEFYYYPIEVKIDAPALPRLIDLHSKKHG